MKAAWFDRIGPAREVLQIGSLETPRPAAGEVLVRVRASGINPSDVKTRSGWMNVHRVSGRVIPHIDGAGVIEAVGEGVDGARVGERVWLHCSPINGIQGTAAEYIALPSRAARRLPDPTGFDEGACLGVPGLTAHHAVLVDGPIRDQQILVAGGAGAVAQYAIQIAKQEGASIIATVSSDEKASIALACGADAVVDYRREDAASRILEWTGGKGVSRIVEVDFGANVALDARVIAPNGIIASYSSSSVREPVFPYYPLAVKGVVLRIIQAHIIPGEERNERLDDLGRRLHAGHLRNHVGRRFALDDIAAAHEAVESGRTIGKVVLDVR
ncbi:MAG: NADPH:quinone reductase [Lautropia sp.]